MFLGSSIQKARSSSIGHNLLNHHTAYNQQRAFFRRETRKSSHEDSSPESTLITSKLLLKPKSQHNESTQITIIKESTLKDKTILDPFEVFEPFNTDDKMRLLMPVLGDMHGNVGKSSRKIAPVAVLGFPLDKIASQVGDQITQKSNGSSKSEIPNLRSKTTLSKFLQEGALNMEGGITRDNKFCVKTIAHDQRVAKLKTNPHEEQDRVINLDSIKKTSYSPIKEVLHENALVKRPKTVVGKSENETERSTHKNQVTSHFRKISCNYEDRIAEDPVARKGSLSKHITNAILKNKKINSKAQSQKRTQTEVFYNADRSESASPSVEVRSTTLGSLITPIKIRSGVSTVRIRSDRSQTSTSRARQSITSNPLGTDSSIITYRVLSTEAGNMKEAPYVKNFLVKVKKYLENKYESPEEKDKTFVKQTVPKEADPSENDEKYALGDSTELDLNSPEKIENIIDTRDSPTEHLNTGMTTESSPRRKSIVLNVRRKFSDNLEINTRNKRKQRYSIAGERLEAHVANVKFDLSQVKTENFINDEKSRLRARKRSEACTDAVTEDKREISEKKETEEKELEEKKETLGDLIRYAHEKTRQIEEYLVGNVRARNKQDVEQSLAFAGLVAVRGGTLQNSLKLNRRNSKGFLTERSQVANIYKEINKLEETLQEERKFHKDFYVAREQALEKAITIEPDHLTVKEFDFVRESFARTPLNENLIPRLDVMLSRLRFFSLLAPEVRKQFYLNAQYVKYKSGDCIFNEGDDGDLMYVLIKGTVNVRVKRIGEKGEVHVITLVSLSDGCHFGDLGMIVSNAKRAKRNQDKFKNQKITLKKIQHENSIYEKKREEEAKGIYQPDVSSEDEEEEEKEDTRLSKMMQNKRTATIICAEDCDLLALGKDKYKEVLAETMNKDMNTKVKLLSTIPFLKDIDTMVLVPFATNLRKETYKFGQRIIKEGDSVMKFYIILKGKCRVVKEIVEDNRAGHDHNKPKLRSFNLKSFEKKRINTGSDELGDSPEEKLQNEAIERIVEKVTGEDTDPSEKEALREKLKSLKYRPVGDILKNVKVTSDGKVFQSQRTFHKERIYEKRPGTSVDSDKPPYISRNHVLHKELTIGSIFGFRPLFRRESDTRYVEMKESKAKLSIVAYSKEVELYVLTRDCLAFIPEGIKNLLVDTVEKIPDFDDFDVKDWTNEYKRWIKFKCNLANEVYTKADNPRIKNRDFYKAT